MTLVNPSRCVFSTLATLAFAFAQSAGAATYLIDFGPNDVTNGNITSSPQGAVYWNNMTNPANGQSSAPLVSISNVPSLLGISVITADWQTNGILNGGLLNPNPALLGNLAVATATQDYFFLNSATAVPKLRISGLNPAITYNLSMFATRNSVDFRSSIYSVTDINGLHTVTLQTSGTGANSGTNALNLSGNDDTIVSLNGLVPSASGTLDFSLEAGSKVSGSTFAYIGALQITEAPEPSSILLSGMGALAALSIRRRNA